MTGTMGFHRRHRIIRSPVAALAWGTFLLLAVRYVIFSRGAASRRPEGKTAVTKKVRSREFEGARASEMGPSVEEEEAAGAWDDGLRGVGGAYVGDDGLAALASRMAAGGGGSSIEPLAGSSSVMVDRFVEGGAPAAEAYLHTASTRAEDALLRHEEREEQRVDQALRTDVEVGAVRYMSGSSPDGSGGTEEELPYLRCGPTYGGEGGGEGSGGRGARELLLLHGAKFTKEDWQTSGIMDSLCLLGAAPDSANAGGLSVTALDLPTSAGGADLSEAFRSLWSAGLIGGDAAFIVSPSASGKAVLGLAELTVTSANAGALLGRVVRGWIPVAPGSALQSSNEVLRSFPNAGIPVLAIHGDKDTKGRKVTERLEQTAGARGLELEGSHPVYLDSPDEFVKAVLSFIDDAIRAEEEQRV